MNNKIFKWFLKHSLTIVCCALITGLGIVFLVWSSPDTTTIGENISTGDITASGNISGTWQGTAMGTQYGGTGQDWSAVATGSIPYFSGQGLMSTLATGTQGYYLKQGTTVPEWDEVLTTYARAATKVVCASSTLDTTNCDYVCDGTNDEMEIQAALVALPSGGGVVQLLEGTYYVESSITLDSNQTLRGNGKNTILTTKTADLDIITATGSSGSEKVGITIANLSVDGNAGGAVNDIGIYWEYVDHSKIQNVWSLDNDNEYGIRLSSSDLNTIAGNTCQGNGQAGIYLYSSSNNTVSGNICQGNTNYGIYLYSSSNNTITGNTCQGNSFGIRLYLSSNNNTVTGNTCQGNINPGIHLYSSSNNTITGNTSQGNLRGIELETSSINNTITGNTFQGNNGLGIYLDSSSNNTVSGNTCQGNKYSGIYLISSSNNNTITGNTYLENSTGTDIAYDNIYLNASNYNLISSNVCRQGGLPNKPRYGIFIDGGDGNVIQGNDLYDSGKTANLNDAGTNTIIRNNRGYTTENSGLAILPAGSNSTTTDHDLAGTPSIVTATATSTDIGDIAVTSKTSTQFTITTSATTTEDVGIYWYAEM